MDSMTKPQLMKTFLTLLDNFIGDLEHTFPEEKEIKVTRSSLKMLGSVNPRMIVEEFMKYISPYKKQLFDEDHRFFMDLSNFELDKSAALKGVKIIELLKNTNQENTNIIFKYMQKLFKIGEKAIS